MKRCTECGFTNKEDQDLCEKCGAVLDEQNPSQLFSIPGGEGESTTAPALPDGLRMTARGTERNASYLDEEEADPAVSSNPPAVFTCPNCWHTPLRKLPSAENLCPNCGYGGSSAAKKAPQVHSSRKQTVMMQDLVFEDDKPSRFRLVNERKKDYLEFQGNATVLNRGNVDPNNPSISSGQHAKIVNENGTWYVEDMSSNRATFVQVNGKVELQPGDRIILGNKIFRFDPE